MRPVIPSTVLFGRAAGSGRGAGIPHVSELILLIEDDEALGAQLTTQLESAGYRVRHEREGHRGISRLDAEVSLVILDLSLPDSFGLDLLRQLRAGFDVPVLVLTALADPALKLRALQLGADDHLSKPCWPPELLERVRARLRRPTLRHDSNESGQLRIDEQARELFVAGERLHLTPTEFALMVALVKGAGKPLTRAVLGTSARCDVRTLEVHVSNLRRKLGGRIQIVTVWGIGYRLETEEVA
jgi:DNA-binding response OmpR family regulator